MKTAENQFQDLLVDPLLRRGDRRNPAGRWSIKTLQIACWASHHGPLFSQEQFKPERSPYEIGQKIMRGVMQRAPNRQCKMFRRRHHTMDAMLEATREASAFLKDFRQEFTDYAVGDEGIAREVALLWEKTAVAFEYDCILRQPPQTHHIDAFTELYAMLYHELTSTLWPPAEGHWSGVQRQMPEQAPEGQYVQLCSKLRKAYAEEEFQVHQGEVPKRSWLSVELYTVTPLASARVVMALYGAVSRAWCARARSVDRCVDVVLCLVAMWSPMHTYKISCKSLVTQARQHSSVFPFAAVHPVPILGCMLVQMPGSGGRLEEVIVLGQDLSVHEGRVAQSMEGEPAMAVGCWHALRAWHRARRTFASEARAESWASSLSALWDPAQGLLSGALHDRLSLKLSGYQGNGLDDVVTKCTVALLKGEPCHKQAWYRHNDGRAVFDERAGVGIDSIGLLGAPEANSYIFEPAEFGDPKSTTMWCRVAKAGNAKFDLGHLTDKDKAVIAKVKRHRHAMPVHKAMLRKGFKSLANSEVAVRKRKFLVDAKAAAAAAAKVKRGISTKKRGPKKAPA